MQRRSFLKNTVMLGSSVALGSRASLAFPAAALPGTQGSSQFSLHASRTLPDVPDVPASLQGKRIGIIGLDTSHSVEFTKVLNNPSSDSPYKGYRVTAAYPYGSRSIASSNNRIPGYIEKMKAFQVILCSTLEELLDQVDCVLLETNDGHLHPQQAAQVFQTRKPVFIDKPLGANLREVKEIFKTSTHYGASFFTSSALRYTSAIREIRAAEPFLHTGSDKITGPGKIAGLDKVTGPGKVLGASCFSPCTIEPSHEDLYWYGIHSVEMLFAVMGPGCKTVQAAHSTDADMAVGTWEDGRIGTFRGTRSGVNAFGGIVFGEKNNVVLGDYDGYEGLLKAIIDYFASGKVPVPMQETKEIYAFMSAFQKSKRQRGKPILLEQF
ncbi:Gfo/Idh/MocA family protein [Flavitalea flava]